MSQRDSKSLEARASLLRSFMRRMAQPVAVVTTRDGTANWGITVSSITSVSMNPPLILVCIDKRAPSREPIIQRKLFSINLLGMEQTNIADVFAGRTRQKDKFQGVDFFLTANGLPVLKGAIGHIECSVWQTFQGGDHDVIIGEVLDGEIGDGLPLIYLNQSYGTRRYSCPACGRPFSTSPE